VPHEAQKPAVQYRLQSSSCEQLTGSDDDESLTDMQMQQTCSNDSFHSDQCRSVLLVAAVGRAFHPNMKTQHDAVSCYLSCKYI
jgi:hypothetical protein